MKRVPDMTIPDIEREIELKEKELVTAKRELVVAEGLVSTLEKNLDLLRLLKDLKKQS